MTIARAYSLPSKTFFLLGPRGVGKSTWIREQFTPALSIDLLQHRTFLQLQAAPDLLDAQVADLARNSWVFIDEIQKLPELLDTVHRIIETYHLRFILTGSSARKLKRRGANLLAGRALTRKMYPFSLHELQSTKPPKFFCTYGTIPVVLQDAALAEETLYSYVETYLREEIREEAAVRRLEQFNRFLQIAGRLNGQILSYVNIAQETGRSSASIALWYDILEETLLGTRLMPYRPGFKVREVGHPKFYWVDPGLARVSAQIAVEDFGSTEMGTALETLVLNELRVYQESVGRPKPIYYYATPGAGEIDFLIERRPKTIDRPAEFVTIEVKSSTRWKSDYEAPSRSLHALAKKQHLHMYGVYLGTERLTRNGFTVYPLTEFVWDLFAGKIF